MTLLPYTYILCLTINIVFLLTFQSLSEFDREEWYFIATAMVLLAPLGSAIIVSVAVYIELEKKQRVRCRKIISQWEKIARDTAKANNENDISKWDWYNEHTESRFIALRDTVRCLSRRDLELLTSVSDRVIPLEKEIKDTLIDELLERCCSEH